MNELISVIIPTYNRGKYIAQAIDSVLKQDYRPLEVIIVDDGSTDATREIVESYGSCIRYFYKDNAGSASARNFGVDKASGKFLAWLDSDDYYLPGKLTAQMNYLLQHPECELVFTQTEDFFDSQETQKKMDSFRCTKISFGGTRVYSATMLARRSVIEKVGPRATFLPAFEDIEWLYRAHFKYEVNMNHCLDDVYLMRRLHESCISYQRRNENLLKQITSLTNTYIRESIRRKHR